MEELVYLSHHGIKGQKWGVRRYQNEDGTLTEAGKKRYGENTGGIKEARDAHKTKAKKSFKSAIGFGISSIGVSQALGYAGYYAGFANPVIGVALGAIGSAASTGFKIAGYYKLGESVINNLKAGQEKKMLKKV